jgi:hypothetical protein
LRALRHCEKHYILEMAQSRTHQATSICEPLQCTNTRREPGVSPVLNRATDGAQSFILIRLITLGQVKTAVILDKFRRPRAAHGRTPNGTLIAHLHAEADDSMRRRKKQRWDNK